MQRAHSIEVLSIVTSESYRLIAAATCLHQRGALARKLQVWTQFIYKRPAHRPLIQLGQIERVSVSARAFVVATAHDIPLRSQQNRSMACPGIWLNFCADLWRKPLHVLGVKNKDVVKAPTDAAAAKDYHVLVIVDHSDRVSRPGTRRLALRGGLGPGARVQVIDVQVSHEFLCVRFLSSEHENLLGSRQQHTGVASPRRWDVVAKRVAFRDLHAREVHLVDLHVFRRSVVWVGVSSYHHALGSSQVQVGRRSQGRQDGHVASIHLLPFLLAPALSLQVKAPTVVQISPRTLSPYDENSVSQIHAPVFIPREGPRLRQLRLDELAPKASRIVLLLSRQHIQARQPVRDVDLELLHIQPHRLLSDKKNKKKKKKKERKKEKQ